MELKECHCLQKKSPGGQVISCSSKHRYTGATHIDAELDAAIHFQGNASNRRRGWGGGGEEVERRKNVIVHNRTHLVAKASPAAVNTSTME